MDNELATYRSQNSATRLRDRRSGGGSLADSTDSVDGDMVTTTHTISEMRVHERSQRGRQSEKRVVVKMAVRQKSHHHEGGDDSDDAGRDMNGTNGNGQYDKSRAITVEEIDDEDTRARARTASGHFGTMNNSSSSSGSSNGALQTTDVNDATIQETMLQLVTETERMKQYFHDQEQAFRRESEYVEQLKKEHQALKTMAKEYKCRAREQKRVQRILREVKKKDGGHSHGDKRKVKKQCQRLQQYQSELALRLELVQSKNNVYEMHVEKQLAELRREYSDSYLFPNLFQRQSGLCVARSRQMIWPDEEHDSSRQLQKKLEYAKELELQIELRRARQREEQLELEELERKFQPDDRSPAKWLVDGGYSAPVAQHLDFASYRSPFRFPQQQQQQDAANDGHQFNGRADSASSPLPPSAGEPSGAPSVGRDGSASNGHTRFRITDLQDQTDRLRERAQQLEWKRILDEQVRENARLKQQEEDERRRDEADSVREEMVFLRDQQLAAQRRMGFPVTTTSQQSPTYSPAAPAAAASPPAKSEHLDTSDDHHHRQVSDYQHRHYERLRGNANLYGFNEPQRVDSPIRHHYEVDSSTMPPPAPSRLNDPLSSPQPNREPVASQSRQQQQSYDSFADSRSLITNEYRSLLADIRREREELRQEKEELRQEKEQLRLERALLQLENEKMANYVDTQRRLNEQQLEMQRQQDISFRQQPQYQQQQQTVSAHPSPMREYCQAPPSSAHRSQRPPAFDLSQINQTERSFAVFGMGNRSGKDTRAPERRPSPISMDDFAVPQNRLSPNAVASPRLKRLSQFRFKPTPADDESNVLDQSLIGESVFVALSPEEVSSAASRGPPRITETASPRRGEKTENSIRNELRSSRVIKSRGFYNIESEVGAFPARAAGKEGERHNAERRKKASAHKSPSRMARSTEKARLQQEKRAAKALKEYETSSKLVPFTPSSSAAGDQHSQQLGQQNKHRQQRQRQFSSSAAAADHKGSGAAANHSGSEDSEEPELSRSLFQVKVLV